MAHTAEELVAAYLDREAGARTAYLTQPHYHAHIRLLRHILEVLGTALDDAGIDAEVAARIVQAVLYAVAAPPPADPGTWAGAGLLPATTGMDRMEWLQMSLRVRTPAQARTWFDQIRAAAASDRPLPPGSDAARWREMSREGQDITTDLITTYLDHAHGHTQQGDTGGQ